MSTCLRDCATRARQYTLTHQSRERTVPIRRHLQPAKHRPKVRIKFNACNTEAVMNSVASYPFSKATSSPVCISSMRSGQIRRGCDRLQDEFRLGRWMSTTNALLGRYLSAQDSRGTPTSASAHLLHYAAKHTSRKLEMYKPTLMQTRLRCYHNSAGPDTQGVSSTSDTKDKDSSDLFYSKLREQLEPYRKTLRQQQWVGWAPAASIAWLKSQGVAVSTYGLQRTFQTWGFRRVLKGDMLEPYKEGLLQRYHAGATYVELGKWLKPQGLDVNARIIQRKLKAWGTYIPHPHVVRVQTNLEAHKESLSELRREGKSAFELGEWLRSHGVQASRLAILKALRSWGISKPIGKKDMLLINRKLELNREQLTRLFRAGLSVPGLSKWLDMEGIETSEFVIRKKLAEWDVFPFSRDNSKMHTNLDPYKETLITKYKEPLSLRDLSAWLRTKNVIAPETTIALSLRKWGVYDAHRWVDPKRATARNKAELIRRYKDTPTLHALHQWLQDQGEPVAIMTMLSHLKKWGVLDRKRHPFLHSLKPFQDALTRLYLEGSSVADLREWLALQDVHVKPHAIRKQLIVWGFDDEELHAVGPGQKSESETKE